MDTPLTPAVFWEPSSSSSAEIALTPHGPLNGTASTTLAGTIINIKNRRRTGGRASVFVIILDVAGWWAFEFTEDHAGAVDLAEILVHDLPLAADPENPQTFVIDASGIVAKLAVSTAGAAGHKNYNLQKIGPLETFSAVEPSITATVVTGFVVPREIVNHGQNVRWTPRYAFRPGPSRATLAAGLRWMGENLPNRCIRAVGSRHSWSPIAQCDDITILPGGWTGIAPLARGEAAANITNPDALFRTHAGTRIREINIELQKRGRALPVLGGFDGQTIGGVLPTGTHGSVLRAGPLADLICSIDLVCFSGKILRIEPARAPVTDPAFIQIADPDLELRRDDDLFDSARIGLGACGVIHSLVLRTVPRFWLREVRTAMDFNKISAALAGGKIYNYFETAENNNKRFANPALPDFPAGAPLFPDHPAHPYHFELLWNPYTGKSLLTSRHPVDHNTQLKLETGEPAFFNNPPVRNIFRLFGFDPMSDAFSRPDLPEIGAAHFGDAGIQILELLAKENPAAIPKLIDSTIDGLVDRNGYIQRSYNVFNIGKAANLLPALSSTISVPLRDDIWLRAAEVIAKVAASNLQKGIVETAPIALRFVAASSAPLADPEDCCKFELIFGGNSADIRQKAGSLIKDYYHALTAAFGVENVRFHWGQIIPPGTLDQPVSAGALPVLLQFPKYNKWRQVRDTLDPESRGLTPWLKSILPE